MRKRILCAMFALLMVVTLLPVVAGADETSVIDLAFTQRETAVGARYVSVGVDMDGNPGFVSATIPVKWDNNVLHLKSVSLSDDIVASESWTGMSMDEYTSNGTYYLVWDNDLREDGDFTTATGCLAELEFEIVDPSVDTSTQLQFDMTDDRANIMNFNMVDLNKTNTVTANPATITVTAQTSGGDTPVDPVPPVDDDSAKFVIRNAKSLKGKNVEVTLDIENNLGLAGATIDITYDSSVLTLEDVTAGDALSKLTISKKISAGATRISFLNMSDAQNDTTNGTAAVLKFKVADAAADGDYTIGLTIVSTSDANFDTVEMTAVGGNVTVFSYVAGNVTGDFDGDGNAVIDIKDAVKLMQIVNGYLEDVEETVLLSANVTGDFDASGNPIIDIRDAVKLMQYVNGYITSFDN